MGWGSIQIRTLTGVVAAVCVAAVFAAPTVHAAAWVTDPQNGCATSNPFPNPNESIRWLGNCAQGKLDGRGTLIWYRDGVETERNDGTFRVGEIDGYAVTRYPDGNVVHGRYAQGQRHGDFMTIRASGEYIAATYYEGRLVNQRRLNAGEIASWQQKGGPQQIETTPPPSAAPKAVASAPPGDEPVSGRTAVASPSRTMPPPVKPASVPGKPLGSAATPSKPASNFTLGTQLAESIAPADAGMPVPVVPSAPAPSAPAAAKPALAAMPTTAPGAPASAALPNLPNYTLGTQAATATSQPGTLAVSAPPPSPPPASNIPLFPARPPASTSAPVAQAPAAAPAPMQPAAPRPTQTRAPQAPPQQVATDGPERGTPTATTTRRPPWMVTGAPDPVALGPAVPGNTPPPLPRSPMASVAPLGNALLPQYPPPLSVQPQYAPPLPQASAAPQPVYPGAAPTYAPDDASPTEASRRYLAVREGGAAAQAPMPQMAALPSYRALQPASPYPPPQAPAAQTAITTGPTTMPPVAMPDGGVYAAGGPEGLFKQGYQLEMSGRFREAEQAYEQVIMSYSSSQTAMLANERLNGLRRFTRESGVRIAGQDAGRQSQVTAVNEPRNSRANEPQPPALPAMPQQSTGGMGAGVSAGESGAGMAANLTGMTVCTQQGLYDKEARWCGIVRADDGKRLSVEIRDVLLPRFGSWSIDASTCTGGNAVNWFSKGTMVRVPRACMEMKG